MTKRKLFLIGIGGIVTAAFGLAAYTLQTAHTLQTNNLGLTRADLALGGFPDVEALRTKTKAVADALVRRSGSSMARPISTVPLVFQCRKMTANFQGRLKDDRS